MARVGVVLAGLVSLASTSVRADVARSPVIDGDYQVGSFGTLRLTSKPAADSRFLVEGAFVTSTRCKFDQGQPLLEGRTEGSVMIGTLTTCIEGSGCQSPAKLPIMTVLSEGVLTGYLSLPKGCDAPGLEQRVSLQLAPDSLMAAGNAFMKAGNFERAAGAFKRLSELPERREDLEVLSQLGAAYNSNKQFAEGRKVLERASVLPSFPTASPPTRSLILYNLGCAEAVLSEKDAALVPRAIAHVGQALAIKGSEVSREDAAADGDLTALRSNPDFQKLLAQKKGPR